jgi:squalene synthase HpnC
MDLANELKKWGPAGTATCSSLAESEEYCRALAQSHYENFSVVSWLFPKHLRQHLCNVYAYCRWADDLADETQEPEESLRLLGWWEGQLDELAHENARPTHPVFMALGETLRERRLPLQPFRDLLVAFRQDQTKLRYETWEELRDYCRFSADPVGRIVLHLGGNAQPTLFAESDSVCTGLQLINFCQDIARDCAKGRIYLPRAEREPWGWTDERFAEQAVSNSPPDESFRELLKFQVDRAEALLQNGPFLANQCGRDLAFPIRVFTSGGLAICAAIRRQNYDVWTRRPVIGKWERGMILLRAWVFR